MRISKSAKKTITPFIAYEKLRQGNEFFYKDGINDIYNYSIEVNELRNPFALVLSDIDEEFAVKSMFRQTSDALKLIGLSGGVLNNEIIKKAEWICSNYEIKVIVVLSHLNSHNIINACNRFKKDCFTDLTCKIKPAIDKENSVNEERNGFNKLFVEKVASIHVENMVDEITSRSLILRRLINSGTIGITGAVFNNSSGKVSFMQGTMKLNSIWLNE